MRIVHVIATLDPEGGGPLAAVLSLAAAQAAMGDDVSVFGYLGRGHTALDPSVIAMARGVPIVALPGHPPANGMASSTDEERLEHTLNEIAGSPSFGYVHLHGIWHGIINFAAKAALKRRIPYVLAPHGMLSPWALSIKPAKKKLALILGRQSMIRNAAWLHALSQAEIQGIRDGRFRANTYLVPNGVFIDEIDRHAISGRGRAAIPGIGTDPYILLLARLHPGKGADVLIDAFATLAPKHPTLKLVLAGPDAGSMSELKSQAARLNLSDRVLFPGAIYGDAKFGVLKDAACFCLPSEHEGFSMSIGEALAVGAPVVISEGCNFPDIAREKAGRVVKRDVPQIASALEAVLNDPAGARDSATRGRRLMESRYNWPAIARRVRDFNALTLGTFATASPKSTQADRRPLIAIISNSQTPYRIAIHRRFVNEIPQVRFVSVYTHDKADQPWESALAEETNPVSFGDGQSVDQAISPASVMADFHRSTRAISWIERNEVAAVFVAGYNDIGRVRLFHWCKQQGIPAFLIADSNIYGDLARGFKRLVKQIVVKKILSLCTAIMPFGSAGARFYYSYGAQPSQVILCPFEPDYGLIESITPEEITAAEAKHKLAPGRKRMVFCGRFQNVKRPDLAIKAFIKVARDIPDADLLLVGEGPRRAECQAMVPPELADRVKFLGFIGDQRELSAVYRGADALVMCSSYEPWALVVNEAVCAGMAMISSDVVGASCELVWDGQNGRMFPSGDVDALAQAMREVMHPDNLPRMKLASRRVLASWRARADPVIGMRTALSRAGILSPLLASPRATADEEPASRGHQDLVPAAGSA
jgi:glycosyltransferase involved in cell wall biosynthesis